MIGYSSKAKLIWDILFKSKRVLAKENKLLREQKEQLQKDYTEKVEFLRYEREYERGIVRGDRDRNRIVVMETPIRGMDDLDMRHCGQMNIVNKELCPIGMSYMHSGVGVETFKHEAAIRLAKLLVDKGFLHTEMQGNMIRFTVNAFGLQ